MPISLTGGAAMNIRINRLRIIFILAAIISQGCKRQSAPETTTLKEGKGDGFFAVCPCNDMQCWNEETKKKSWDNLKCAADAAGAIAPILEIPLSLGVAATEIATAASDVSQIIASLDAGGSLLKAVSAASPDCAASIATHIQGVQSIVSKSLKASGVFKKISNESKAGSTNYTEIYSALTGTADLGNALIKMVEASSKIISCLDKSEQATSVVETVSTLTRLKTKLLKLSDPWGSLSIAKKLDISLKVTKCGVSIVRGTWTLGNNLSCLSSDYKYLRTQEQQIANQRECFVNGAIGGTNDCANGDRAPACMTKYGIYLHKIFEVDSEQQPIQCVSYCANPLGSRRSWLKSSLPKIFPVASDLKYCSQIADFPQTRSGIGNCISYCCGQDEDCIKASQKYR